MRKSVVRLFVVTSVAITFPLIAQNSYAQKPKGKKPAATATAEVELDAKPVATGAANTQAKDLGPPPQAGQMTEDAAKATRLFDAEKWEEAALALDRRSQLARRRGGQRRRRASQCGRSTHGLNLMDPREQNKNKFP